MPYFERLLNKALQLLPRKAILRYIGFEYISANDKFNLDGHNERLFNGHLLNSNSVVVVLGGFTGNSINEWSTRYSTKIIAYEPVPAYFQELKKRFASREEIEIFDYAAGGLEKDIRIGLDDEKTGEFNSSSDTTLVKMVDIVEHLNSLGIFEIDLIEINIEGGEYDVLERLLRKENNLRVKKMLIQFHDLLIDHPFKREYYRKLLREHYSQVWNYDWVWEAWEESSFREKHE